MDCSHISLRKWGLQGKHDRELHMYARLRIVAIGYVSRHQLLMIAKVEKANLVNSICVILKLVNYVCLFLFVRSIDKLIYLIPYLAFAVFGTCVHDKITRVEPPLPKMQRTCVMCAVIITCLLPLCVLMATCNYLLCDFKFCIPICGITVTRW